MNKEKIKMILSYIFSFLLLISILVSFILNLASRTVLSEDYMVARLLEINYYTKIMSIVQSDFEGYIEQSGFDKTILENVYTEKQITKDVNSVIHNIYHNNNHSINITTIQQNLNTNIDNYINNNNLTLDVKQKENVTEFVNTLTASYVKDIFPKDIIIPISNMVSLFNSTVFRVSQFIHLLPYIFILCIILINISKILTSFKYISVAILSSGMFLSLSYIIISNTIKIGKVTIFTEGISDMLNLLFINIFNEINLYCIIFSLIGLLLTFIFIVIEDRFDIQILSHKGTNASRWLYKY